MKIKIPFKKDIKFNNKIVDITSISLEHELNIKADEVVGDFIITGEYRSHEISVNREPFLHRLPFSVNLTDDIDPNSINFEIDDFKYEIINDNVLSVDIEFFIEAEEIIKENKVEIEKEIIADPLELIIEKNEEREEVKQEMKVEETKLTDENLVVKSSNTFADTFITYQIHIVRENETIENICEKYKTTTDLLSKYNNIETVSLNDKLIIPQIDE